MITEHWTYRGQGSLTEHGWIALHVRQDVLVEEKGASAENVPQQQEKQRPGRREAPRGALSHAAPARHKRLLHAAPVQPPTRRTSPNSAAFIKIRPHKHSTAGQSDDLTVSATNVICTVRSQPDENIHFYYAVSDAVDWLETPVDNAGFFSFVL